LQAEPERVDKSLHGHDVEMTVQVIRRT
jgi:hypothetical protein